MKLAYLVLPVGIALAILASNGAEQAGCRPVDGDTIDCGGERIRLLAIDAPELATSEGEPSKASLAAGLSMGPPQIHRFGKDRYGRTVADVEAGGVSLSCYQIVTGAARYWPRYDRNRRIAKDCGL